MRPKDEGKPNMINQKIEDMGLAKPSEVTRDHLEIHLKYLIKQVDKIDKKLEDNYVTYKEFKPIKNIVYGVVTVMVMSVLGILLNHALT